MTAPVTVRKRAPKGSVPKKPPLAMPAMTELIDDIHGAPAPKLGLPPKYRPQHAELAYKLCLMGATSEKLGDIFGVPEVTIRHWLKTHPEFHAAVHAGKDAADAEIANSLYGRALGYSHKTTKVLIIDGKPHQEQYIEHHPPDTNAAKFWLMNRQPDKWREKMEVDNTHRVVLTEEQINERLQKLLPPA